jgi:hypothetical protein
MRSDDEMLALVKERAAHLQRRRRGLAAGGTIAAVATIALLVALALPGTSTGRRIETTGPEDSTTLPSTSTSALDTSTSTSTPDTTSTSSTTSEVSLTSVPPTSIPDTTTTTDWTPPPECAANEVTPMTTTDKASYAPGELVTITVSARNDSGHDCQPAATDKYTIMEGSTPIAGGGVGFALPIHAVWRAGSVDSFSFTWNQLACPPPVDLGCTQGQVAAGTYTIVGAVGAYTATTTITIT